MSKKPEAESRSVSSFKSKQSGDRIPASPYQTVGKVSPKSWFLYRVNVLRCIRARVTSCPSFPGTDGFPET